MKAYAFQLSVYKKAVMQIFGTSQVRSCAVFTHRGEIREG
jgi:hypothetical protein